MNSWGKNCLIIFILETPLLVFLMTPERVTRVMAMEGVKIENSLGTSTMRELDKRASESFNSMFIESGLYADLWHTLIPTEDEKKNSGALKNTGGGLFRWIDDRLTVCMFLFFQILERFHLMALWFPSCTLIFIASIYSGLALRRIKQGSFAFSSPTAHRTGMRAILIMLACLPLYFMFPTPITPYLYPLLNLLWAYMLMLIISNIAKRI